MVVRVWKRLRGAAERGATTAEYAVLIMAAVTFAGVLATILRGGVVKNLLAGIVTRALT